MPLMIWNGFENISSFHKILNLVKFDFFGKNPFDIGNLFLQIIYRKCRFRPSKWNETRSNVCWTKSVDYLKIQFKANLLQFSFISSMFFKTENTFFSATYCSISIHPAKIEVVPETNRLLIRVLTFYSLGKRRKKKRKIICYSNVLVICNTMNQQTSAYFSLLSITMLTFQTRTRIKRKK